MKGLESRGLLRLDKRSDSIRATRFSVNSKLLAASGHNLNSFLAKPIGYVPQLPKVDAFHRFALGKTGKLIVELFNHCIGTELGIKDIVELIRVSRRTVEAKLKVLEKHGVVKSGREKGRSRPRAVCWIDRPIENLLSIAIEKGTDGKAFAQERKIDRKRRAYLAYMKEKAIEKAKRNNGEIEKRYEVLFSEK